MKKIIIINIIFVITTNLFGQVVTQNTGGCSLDGVSDSQWITYYTNEAVNDTERTLFKSFAFTDVTEVTVGSTSSVYATASLNDSHVLITPTSDFEEFEANEASSSSTPILIIILIFTCTSGSSQLYFRQPITDINNHDPTFSSSSYTYSLPMPFPSGITVSGIFGDSITATDIDITNVALTFAIEPEGDFTIEYGAVTDSTNKIHTAILKTATSIRLTSTTTYTLTVTDQGTLPGTRSTNATLIIEVDEENSISLSPMFSSSYYKAVYTKVTDSDDYITLDADITLNDSDYENTTFAVQGDYSNYFSCSGDSDKVNFILSANIPDDILTSNSYILVPIQSSRPTAEYTGSTVVVIDLSNIVDSEISSPTFDSPYYLVTYSVNEEGSDTISGETSITLSDNDYENTNFSLAGEYSAYFNLNSSNNQIDLTLLSSLPEDVLYSTQFVLITLTASRNGAEVDGNTVIVVTLPGEQCIGTTTESTTDCPTITTEVVTVTECPTETPVTCTPCPTDLPSTTTEFTSTVPTVVTDITTQNPIITTTYTTPFTIEYTTEQAVTCPPCPTDLPSTTTEFTNTVSTVVPDITTQNPVTTECPTVTTECPTVTTECPSVTTECPTVATECPTVTTECPTVTTVYPIMSTECPTVTTECPTVSTECPTITTECPTVSTECPTITTECPIVTTECSPTTCDCTTNPTFTPTTPVTYTTYTDVPTTEPSTTVINFDKSYYTFDLQPLHTIGVIGSVSATSSMDESIIYSIAASDGSTLPSQLTMNEQTGELVTSNYITSGSYYLVATARGNSSSSTDNAFILVYVSSVQICDTEVRTAYSIVSKHITEEQQNYDILTLNVENYTYAIVEQFPVTNPFVFEINSTTGSLQTVGSINREWEGIANMYVSQFTVRVRLLGIDETFEPTLEDNATFFYSYENPVYREVYQEEGRAWVNIEEILYNIANDTVVSVIVDDINDNPPVFTAGSVVIVGYPDNEIVADIAPASLVTVEATDADIGINALIRYSTDSDSILVNESTGVVYIGASIFDDGDEKEFTITATDRNGSSDGLSSTVNIQVKKLEDEHLTVLTISGATLEDVDTILEIISAYSGYSVKELTASVIPSSAQSTRVRAASDYSLKLVTYAFDSNNDLIETETLQEAIASANTSDAYGAISWAAFSRSATASSTTTGYLVSVIVLSILLALFVVAAAIYYFRYYRRRSKLYEKMMEENSPTFKKNEKISHADPKKSDLSNRRPTDFIFSPRPSEFGDNTGDKVNVESTKSDLANRRSTEFAFHPPPIDGDGVDPEGNIHSVSIKSELANRRSTEFAFHPPPIEDDGGGFENSDDYSYYTVNNGSIPNGKAPGFSLTNTILKFDDGGSNESSTDEIKLEDEANPGKRERRKSVTFNVNVEKIEIEKDDDDDNDDNDDDDDYEEENPYDEVEMKNKENENDSNIEIARL